MTCDNPEIIMKLCCLVILLALFFAAAAFAQPDSLWSNALGGSSGEACYTVLQAADGGYVLGGYTQTWGAGWNDFWLVKTNANGDSLWSRTFGGGDNNKCEAMIQTDDGGLALIGSKELWENGAYNQDFWLIRTNANGDSLWSRTYGGPAHEWGFSLQPTSDHGFIMSGTTTIYGLPLQWDFALTKASASGDSAWSRRYGGPDEERSYHAFQTSDGGYLVSGYTKSFGQGQPLYSDGWVVKTNANGDSLWSRAYGGEYADEFTSACQTSDGGYILAGTTNSFGEGTPGYLNYWLVRINSVGDTLWTKTYGGIGSDGCEALLMHSDGGFILVGTTSSYGSGNSDIWIVRTDAHGNLLWHRAFGGSDWDRGYAIAPTSDGGYIVGGETSSFGFVDMWLVKTGPDGGGGGGETTLLSESFDGGFPPAGWQTQQLGPTTENWQPLADAPGASCGDEAHSGSNAVYHNDDDGTADVDVRDVLISPVINVPANASDVHLSFYQRNCYVPNYYTDSTHHWAMSSINGGAWTLLAEPNQEQADWAEISVAIAGAVGQQVRIAFDYQGDYATEWYLDDVEVTARVAQASDRTVAHIPETIALWSPYPNPFNPTTAISFELTSAAHVSLRVFDLLGREVAVLKKGLVAAGTHRVVFDGGGLASGIYFARLDAGDYIQTKKIVLMR
ncbi:T9SS C-terminal target domain-containing protein [candidate division KSB1 bacterium]|nr:MAG: T9SS C-terminal target domain-containing protein [candidate division KSB1 bacterium]